MRRALLWYVRKEVRPRWREIVTEPEAIVCALAGVAAAIWGNQLALGSSKVGDLLTVVLAYAAVAFGFCLAGLTLAMTLPNDEFVSRLAQQDEKTTRSWRKRRPAGFTENAYSRLLFVFSWTAVIHWLVIVASLAMLTTRGFDAMFLPSSANFGSRALVAVQVFTLLYAAAQFLVTLVTLSQVGSAYVSQIRRTADSPGRASQSPAEPPVT